MKWLLSVTFVVGFLSTALAEEITYRQHIKPLMKTACSVCHGAKSPYAGDFKETKEIKDQFVADKKGPRMDTYADVLFFIAWPDTGAIMRRLDDGKQTKDNNPGNMYEYLGDNEEERQKNLALFKQWIGAEAWNLKRRDAITKEELLATKAKY